VGGCEFTWLRTGTSDRLLEYEMGEACSTYVVTGEMRNAELWLENLKKRDYSEDLGVDGRTILEWFLERQSGELWTGFTWLKVGPLL
jgi:hypothetical protein